MFGQEKLSISCLLHKSKMKKFELSFLLGIALLVLSCFVTALEHIIFFQGTGWVTPGTNTRFQLQEGGERQLCI